MTELCRNKGTRAKRPAPLRHALVGEAGFVECHAVFLSNRGGACAAYRSAALNLRIGSLYEWSVALVVVRCESSQSSHDIARIALLDSAAVWSLLWILLNRESKSC
jgi:hypothetical protein